VFLRPQKRIRKFSGGDVSKQLEAFGPLKCELVIKGSAATQKPQHKCGREARRFRVLGNSYECFTVLCRKHELKAREEGFGLLDYGNQSADFTPGD
jgi:hypothetical protein